MRTKSLFGANWIRWSSCSVADPACEIVTSSSEGLNATCRMTFQWQPLRSSFVRVPNLEVSLSWDGVSGTTVSTTPGPNTHSETLETRMKLVNVSRTIPPHRCTIEFAFSTPEHALYQYAENSVSYTCVTEEITLHRKYNACSLYNMKEVCKSFQIWKRFRQKQSVWVVCAMH